MTDPWLPYFSDDELRCKCGCGLILDTPRFIEFMAIVIVIREVLDFSFPVNSGCRCPTYNDSFYGSKGDHLDGPHTKGAMDVGVRLEQGARLVREAMNHQMGVGDRQHGEMNKRMVHIDNEGFRKWTYDAG